MVSEDHLRREAGHHDKPDVDWGAQVDSQAKNALAYDVQGRVVGAYQMSLNVAEGLYQDTWMIGIQGLQNLVRVCRHQRYAGPCV